MVEVRLRQGSSDCCIARALDHENLKAHCFRHLTYESRRWGCNVKVGIEVARHSAARLTPGILGTLTSKLSRGGE